LKKIPTF